MTSYKKAEAEGLPWPLGPDDLCPSKQQNQYLYAGGRTSKLRYLLYTIWGVWGAGNYALDKYLTKNRAYAKQNYLLEQLCMRSTFFWFPTAAVLFVGIPIAINEYWFILNFVVGAKAPNRDPRPNWPAGEGILDKIKA